MAAHSPEQDRRIELAIRSQYEIPADYQLTLGSTARSQLHGYYDLPVTFSHAGKDVRFAFLLSEDGRRLARIQEFDLAKEDRSVLPPNSNRVRGNPNALVTITVFDDLECPFCAGLQAELFPDILNRYGGLVRVAYKDYPLTGIHPWALHAAVDAGCLAAQSSGAYWDYVGTIHTEYADFSPDKTRLTGTFRKLDEMAKHTGGVAVDQRLLAECLEKQDDGIVRASLSEGSALGVSSAPTMFVNGERIVGAQPVDWISSAIDRALVSQGINLPATAEGARTQGNPPSGAVTGR
jgi:protein-disulfide isomerase